MRALTERRSKEQEGMETLKIDKKIVDYRVEGSKAKASERVAEKAAAVEPPVRTSAPVAAAIEGLVVQVFASPNGEQAQKLLGDLKQAGYQAFLSSTRIDGQTMHRVRIGPFQDRSQAEAVKRRVDKAYKVTSFITTNE